MYLVTGAAGFIGSHLVRELNRRGIFDILAVDDLSEPGRFGNLADCRFGDYMDRAELQSAIRDDRLTAPIDVVLHQGACTDTTRHDGKYMMANNFTCSKLLLEWALARRVPFVYASSGAVYGAASSFAVSPDNEMPINVYGFSKLALDQYVRGRIESAESTVVGLRYFNVYGPREEQKRKMASIVHQLHRQLAETGVARLFDGTDGFGPGEQQRDFVFVSDVVQVNLFFADGPPKQGIFNVGTGQARSFNDVANTLIDKMGPARIEYIPFDPALEGKYQSFTQADIASLRAAGYNESFTTLEDGVAQCLAAW